MPDINRIKKLYLVSVFQKLRSDDYCIVKIPDSFPDYDIGSDLDIFCLDMELVAKKILSVVHTAVDQNTEVQVTTRPGQMYIDLLCDGRIHFRFDLYGELPHYSNVHVKKYLFFNIVEDCREITVGRGELTVKVPSEVDEALLRYIEYHEWYAQRPDKIKHIEYLQRQIESDRIDLKKMLKKLHYYTALPRTLDNRVVNKSSFSSYVSYVGELVRKAFKSVRNKGLVETLVLIKRRSFN